MSNKYYVATFSGNIENEYEEYANDLDAINGFLQFARSNGKTILEIHECQNDECLTPSRLVYPAVDGTADLIQQIALYLPHTPDYQIWSPDGDEILCETEQLAEHIADLFDAIYGEQTVNTGYYDPVEDKSSGEVDERTGWYYVTIN